MKVYFYMDGSVWAKGEEKILEEHIVVEMDEDVQLWRYSYDVETETASIKYPKLNDADALVELEKDQKAAEEVAIAKRDAEIAAATAE